MKKQQLRNIMKEKRQSLDSKTVLQKSELICKELLSTDLYKNAKFIALYMPIKNEVDIKPLIIQAYEDGKRVCVPVTKTETNDIFLAEIKSGEDFIEGNFGIREPKNKEIINPNHVDLMLLPGLAFDCCGNRVGWGRGFYDRLTAGINVAKVGVAYEFQLCDMIEAEPHDCKMNYILTESELVFCG